LFLKNALKYIVFYCSSNYSSYPSYIHYRDKYDLSYIAKVNPFWLQFEPPKSSTFLVMAALYCLISVVGCVGNAFVIFMFANRKSLRTPANILVMNLAICDFLMLIKCPIAIYNNIKEGPALGDIGECLQSISNISLSWC